MTLASVGQQNALVGLWRNPATGATLLICQYRSARGRGYPRELMQTVYTSKTGVAQAGYASVPQLQRLLAQGWVRDESQAADA